MSPARRRAGRSLVQAGASGTGRDVAARLAELVFTAQTTFEQAKEFYADVHGAPAAASAARRIR